MTYEPLSPGICTQPSCPIPRKPGRPMHGPHDFVAASDGRHARADTTPETGNLPGRRPELGGSDRKSSGTNAGERLAKALVAGVQPSVCLDELLDEVEAARILLPMSLQQPAAHEAAQALGLARDALRDARTYAEVGEHL